MAYDKHYFDNIDTEAKAYFLGLALADATITKYWYEPRNKFMYRFKFNPSSEDIIIMNRFSQEIGAECKIVETYTKKRSEPYVNATIEIKNKHLVTTLIENFGGSLKPDRVRYSVPEQFKSHFIRGYFDGDGSLNCSSGHWELALNGNEYILKQILSDVNISVNITNDKSTKRARLRKVNDIDRFLDFIYCSIDISEKYPLFLPRKYEKANQFKVCLM